MEDRSMNMPGSNGQDMMHKSHSQKYTSCEVRDPVLKSNDAHPALHPNRTTAPQQSGTGQVYVQRYGIRGSSPINYHKHHDV